MRKIVLALLFLASSVPAQESFFKPTRETLTLKSSLERASRNNSKLLELGKELSIAKAHSREAASLFYPRVNLNLNYSRYRNETLGLTMPELGSVVIQPSIPVGANEPESEALYYGRKTMQKPFGFGWRIMSSPIFTVMFERYFQGWIFKRISDFFPCSEVHQVSC